MDIKKCLDQDLFSFFFLKHQEKLQEIGHNFRFYLLLCDFQVNLMLSILTPWHRMSGVKKIGKLKLGHSPSSSFTLV